jgi:hypothetical protein
MRGSPRNSCSLNHNYEKTLILCPCDDAYEHWRYGSNRLLDEDFEAGIPSTWSQTTLATDGGWIAGTSTTLSSSAMPFAAMVISSPPTTMRVTATKAQIGFTPIP